MDHQDLAKQYKNMIAKQFPKFIQTDLVQNLMKEFGFDKYQFVIATENDIENMTKLLVPIFKAQNAVLTVLKPKEHEIYNVMKHSIETKINCSRCFVAKDKNKIIASLCVSDYYEEEKQSDSNTANTSQSIGSKNLQHTHEIFEMLRSEQELIAKKFTNGKYGALAEAGHYCKDDNYKTSRFLALFLAIIVLYFMMNRCGYKYIIGQTTHKNVNRLVRRTNANIGKTFDVSNYIFKDGTKINYYFDKLRNEENYDEQQISELKNALKIHITLTDINGIEKGINTMKKAAKQISKNKRKSKL